MKQMSISTPKDTDDKSSSLLDDSSYIQDQDVTTVLTQVPIKKKTQKPRVHFDYHQLAQDKLDQVQRILNSIDHPDPTKRKVQHLNHLSWLED